MPNWIPSLDPVLLRLLGGVFVLLVVASVIGAILARRATSDGARATIRNLNARTAAWWVMVVVFGAALLIGRAGTVILFGLLSFLALREFVTLTPTRRGDHRTLFWAFFVITPLQYWIVWRDWYGMFAVLIPVWAFLFVPLRSALAGDCAEFLGRTARIQWALMICVFCVSHAPMLLTLRIPGYEGSPMALLLYLVLVAQLSDVFQYVWGKTLGRHKIVPDVSPNKTWEGFVGGILTASGIGAALWWATPFTPWQSALVSFLICLAGFAGGLVMSAIKRDRGVKDYGTLIEGHGGVMDRIDSLCFAAPVYFHLIRYFWT
jgi:phosphatidate cytidylyltransferase